MKVLRYFLTHVSVGTKIYNLSSKTGKTVESRMIKGQLIRTLVGYIRMHCIKQFDTLYFSANTIDV